jgi:hypothetical protein
VAAFSGCLLHAASSRHAHRQIVYVNRIWLIREENILAWTKLATLVERKAQI